MFLTERHSHDPPERMVWPKVSQRNESELIHDHHENYRACYLFLNTYLSTFQCARKPSGKASGRFGIDFLAVRNIITGWTYVRMESQMYLKWAHILVSLWNIET